MGLRSHAHHARVELRHKLCTIKPRVTKNKQSGRMSGFKIRAEQMESKWQQFI